MNILDTFVEIELPSKNNADADFLKIRETLTRIGIASKADKKLYQSCHILHKQGKYYIVHFKEMFLLDGREANFEEDDKVRRNIIAKRLEEWDLLKIVDPDKVDNKGKTAFIKVISYSEKDDWTLVTKYNLGKHKKAA